MNHPGYRSGHLPSTMPGEMPLDERIQRAIESGTNIGIHPRKVVSLLPDEWQTIICALQRQREQPVEVAKLVKRLRTSPVLDSSSALLAPLLLEAASAFEYISAQVAELQATLNSEHDAHMECHAKAEAADKLLADSESKRQAAENDAERYRLLKSNAYNWPTVTGTYADIDDLEAAIDAKMEKPNA